MIRFGRNDLMLIPVGGMSRKVHAIFEQRAAAQPPAKRDEATGQRKPACDRRGIGHSGKVVLKGSFQNRVAWRQQ